MKFFLAMITFLFGTVAFADNDILLPDMIGRWSGGGRQIMTWCNQQTIDITLNILSDGRVEGRFGDAMLRSGSIDKNNFFLRLLGNSEYIINADLDGPIVASEKIRRESIKILLNFKDGKLAGSFHTAGSEKSGGKETMSMSGIDVKLEKS